MIEQTLITQEDTEQTIQAKHGPAAERFLMNLFKKIEHGDAEHRKWLENELREFIPVLAEEYACAGEEAFFDILDRYEITERKK